jgi:hypothetical protein
MHQRNNGGERMNEEKKNCSGAPDREEAKEGGRMEENTAVPNATVNTVVHLDRYTAEVIAFSVLLYKAYTRKLDITPEEFDKIAKTAIEIEANERENYDNKQGTERIYLVFEMIGKIVKAAIEETEVKE